MKVKIYLILLSIISISCEKVDKDLNDSDSFIFIDGQQSASHIAVVHSLDDSVFVFKLWLDPGYQFLHLSGNLVSNSFGFLDFSNEGNSRLFAEAPNGYFVANANDNPQSYFNISGISRDGVLVDFKFYVRKGNGTPVLVTAKNLICNIESTLPIEELPEFAVAEITDLNNETMRIPFGGADVYSFPNNSFSFSAKLGYGTFVINGVKDLKLGSNNLNQIINSTLHAFPYLGYSIESGNLMVHKLDSVSKEFQGTLNAECVKSFQQGADTININLPFTGTLNY